MPRSAPRTADILFGNRNNKLSAPHLTAQHSTAQHNRLILIRASLTAVYTPQLITTSHSSHSHSYILDGVVSNQVLTVCTCNPTLRLSVSTHSRPNNLAAQAAFPVVVLRL
jgi:hypothetical protein